MLQTEGKVKYAAILLVTATLALLACGGKPLHTSKWQDDGDEMRPGPGLFSGEDGEFAIEPE
jgi:hypothetical protein